ncbi:MAG: hypothetical protein J6O23_09445 [Prevotella sp.]|nr:hypothetical protein [Prevotella sp.]
MNPRRAARSPRRTEAALLFSPSPPSAVLLRGNMSTERTVLVVLSDADE